MSDEAKVLHEWSDRISSYRFLSDGRLMARAIYGQDPDDDDTDETEWFELTEVYPWRDVGPEFARLVAAARWIPVTERLPEDVVTVAVYLPKFGEVLPLYYSARWDEWADGHGFSCGIAGTMWQPLPPPPQP